MKISSKEDMGVEGSPSEKREVTLDTAESPHGPVPDVLVNASGHKQELERNFGLLSICAVAVTTGNTWIALGGGLVCCYLHKPTRGISPYNHETILLLYFYPIFLSTNHPADSGYP